MKKFLVLYRAPLEEFQKAMTSWTKEEQEESMKDWGQWMTKHKDALADGGAPVGKTKQVSTQGIKDIQNDIGGYSIVQANSHEEAAEIFSDSPHFKVMKNGTVELMEILMMPG